MPIFQRFYIFFLFCTLSSVKLAAQEPRLVLPIGHTGTIYATSFSPNEKYMLSSGMENQIFLWDVASGKLLRVLNGHQSAGIIAKFTSDGKHIISIASNPDAQCFVWDFTTGQVISKFSVSSYDALSEFSTNLLLVNEIDSIKIFDIRKKKFVFLQQKTSEHLPVTDGKGNFYIVAASNGKYAIEKYSLTTFTLLAKTPLRFENAAQLVRQYSPETRSNGGNESKKRTLGYFRQTDENILSFNFSKTAKYLTLTKSMAGQSDTDAESDSLMLIDCASGKLIYAGLMDRRPFNFRSEKRLLSFFNPEETVLIWKGQRKVNLYRDYIRTEDVPVVFHLQNKTVKKLDMLWADDKVILKDSTLYTFETSMVTAMEFGTRTVTHIFETNIFTGVKKPMYRMLNAIANTVVKGKYLVCLAKNGDQKNSFYGTGFPDMVIWYDPRTRKIISYPNKTIAQYLWSKPNSTKFAAYSLESAELEIYDVAKSLSPLTIAKVAAKRKPVLDFVHQDSLLYTGERFLNLTNMDGSTRFNGNFVTYVNEQSQARLFEQKDSTTKVYDMKNFKLLRKLLGAPIIKQDDSTRYEDYDGDYLFTTHRGNTYAGSVTRDINFKALGEYKLIDDTQHYLLTASNDNMNLRIKKNSFSFGKKHYVDTLPSQTSVWNLTTGKLVRKFDLPLDDYVLDNTKTLRYIVMIPNIDTALTILYDVQQDQMHTFKGEMSSISDDMQYLYTEPDVIRKGFKTDTLEAGRRYTIATGEFVLREKEPKQSIVAPTPTTAKSDTTWFANLQTFDQKFTLKMSHTGDGILHSVDGLFTDLHFKIVLNPNRKDINWYEDGVLLVSPLLKYAFFSKEDRHIIIDLTSKKMISINVWSEFRSAAFLPGDEILRTTSIFDSPNYTYWNIKTGKEVLNISGISRVAESAKGDKVASHDAGATTLYHMPSGKSYLTYVELDSLNYLLKINSGYYMATPDGAKQMHYVNKDLKIITFDQLDVRYNRPDKVLEAIGSKDTTLIQSYKKAYEKRIKKLGVDTTAFRSGYSVPEADFKNRALIASEVRQKQLKLHIQGSDKLYKLDRFNIWVNESPIFGIRGANLKKRNKKEIDTTITITLSDGENQIETSITNVNGTESYRMPLMVNYVPLKETAEKVYFVGIGIDQFAQKEQNLQWSVKDISDLAVALKAKYGNSIQIDTLFNQRVTLANVKALKKKLQASNVNAKVIIAYSGHGLLSSDYDYYLSTYAVDFDNPAKNGLPYDELENLLDQIPARKKLMLIDACHSGEVDKEELLKYKNAEQQLAANLTKGAKGVKILNTSSKKAGMRTSLELMQQLFANVGKSTGATVISAAAGTQFALEKSDLKNGVFSYSILEFMKQNQHATVADLKQYVNKRVTELTSGLQVPTTRKETKKLNWQVW